MTPPRILAMAGSLRRESHNRRLLAAAVVVLREASPVEIDLVAPDEMRLPLYDGDLEAEQGLPTEAVALRERLDGADGLLIACPEYNHSLPGMFKNVIDWTSRPSDGIASTAATRGKVAALLSASPGGFGGMRGLVHVRAILSGIGVVVIPDTVSVSGAHKAFAEDGSLADEKLDARLSKVVKSLVDTTSALRQMVD